MKNLKDTQIKMKNIDNMTTEKKTMYSEKCSLKRTQKRKRETEQM